MSSTALGPNRRRSRLGSALAYLQARSLAFGVRRMMYTAGTGICRRLGSLAQASGFRAHFVSRARVPFLPRKLADIDDLGPI